MNEEHHYIGFEELEKPSVVKTSVIGKLISKVKSQFQDETPSSNILSRNSTISEFDKSLFESSLVSEECIPIKKIENTIDNTMIPTTSKNIQPSDKISGIYWYLIIHR